MQIKAIKKYYSFDSYRVLTVAIFGLFLYLHSAVREKFQTVCYPDFDIERCTDAFRSYLHSPLTSVYSEVLLLLFILFLLPTRLLRNWFFYIGSWAVPASIWYVSVTKETSATFTWITSPSDAALLSVTALTWLTIAYAGVYLARHIWRTRKTTTQ